MESKVTIKNFRVFDEEGVTVDLKPITILTGCNSAGKSSVTKAVSLLHSFLSNWPKNSLDFTTYPNNLLGNFDNVVHKGASSKEVTFEYTTHSGMLAEDVTVQLVFSTDENDELHNGWLEKITMRTSDGVFFSSDKKNGSVCNYNLIKEAGLCFLLVDYELFGYCLNCSSYEFDIIAKEELERRNTNVKQYLSQFDKDYINDIIAYERCPTKSFSSIIDSLDIEPNVIEWSLDNGSLFMIPVIDDLNKLAKGEIKEWIRNNILVSATKKLSFYTDKIIDDFIASKHLCFGDYFKEYETKFLEKSKIDVFSLKGYNISDGRIMYITGNDDNFDEKIDISFELLYEAIMQWNRVNHESENDYYEEWEKLIKYQYKTDHKLFNKVLRRFVGELVEEVLSPNWSAHIGGGSMEYASSSRAKINRLYALELDDDFTRLIKRYLNEKRGFVNERNTSLRDSHYIPDSFINKWVYKLEIGFGIKLLTDDDGFGARIRLFKSANDKDGRLLADEGYGITQLYAILLQIETAILSARRVTGDYSYLDDLDGYKSDEFHYGINTILIEEPEIHLHPALQSKLADMLLDAYQNYNIHFIVETHSEYLIRKSQVLVSKMNFKSNEESNSKSPFRTYYVPRNGSPYSLGYRKDGKFAESFGSGFYDESANLAFEIM